MTTIFQARIPITPGVMHGLRYAHDVNLSPDARRGAFEVGDWATGQRKRRSTIWVAETSDGEVWQQKPLSKSGRHDDCPRWSPDGSQHVPVEFVIYPREPHGVTEREHQRDFEERILKWLERYL